jgi:hypothetical protein
MAHSTCHGKYVIFRFSIQLRAKEDNSSNNKNQNKWAIFTYTGNESRSITKLFKDFKINISYHTRNTVENILKQRSHRNQYDENGVYGLQCQNRPGMYIGQTGRSFEIRYKEYVQDIKKQQK